MIQLYVRFVLPNPAKEKYFKVSALFIFVHALSMREIVVRATRFVLVPLIAISLQITTASALPVGASVYVREGDDTGDWVLGEYLSERSDCLKLERIHPYPQKAAFLRLPESIKEEKVEVGDEVNELAALGKPYNSRMPAIVDRVIAVQQRCYEVKYAGGPFRIFVKPGSLIESSDFLKLRGAKGELSVGEMVYIREPHQSPERWGHRKISATRTDCHETDSEQVVTGNYLDEENLGNGIPSFFMTPGKVNKRVSEGELLNGFSLKGEDADGRGVFKTLEGRVKSKNGGNLIVESSNTDCYEEIIEISKIRKLPVALGFKEYAALKIGDIVLEMIDPACCCCRPFYLQRKILSKKKNCYILQKEGINSLLNAAFTTQLISVDALNARLKTERSTLYSPHFVAYAEK